MRAPEFWRHKGPASTLLMPIAGIYGRAAKARQAKAKPVVLPVPVICIGNLVAGGAGKTPLALAVGEIAARLGKKAFFLSRGYGGKLQGPLRVDFERHRANEVGDEPLLLARLLPTVVAKDRAAGARLALEQGAEAIILDDGFQNASLAKTISLLAVDGEYGFGNGRLIPAGPLREKMEQGLSRADAVVVIGGEMALSIPTLKARIIPVMELKGKIFGFAGIGRPEKFRSTLKRMGCDVAGFVAFSDHHAYAEKELLSLERSAAAFQAGLATTEKDWVRLSPEWREKVAPVPVRLEIEQREILMRMLERVLCAAA